MWNDRNSPKFEPAVRRSWFSPADTGDRSRGPSYMLETKSSSEVIPLFPNDFFDMTTTVTKAINEMNQITIVAQPGPLGIYVDEIPGEEYLFVGGLLRNSPLHATEVKAGDRLHGIDGLDLKGWTLEKLASYCKDHADSLKSIEILQSSTTKFGFTPRKIKSIPHRKSSPPKSSKLRTIIIRPTPPPMYVFELLRPTPPIGYERKIVDVPSGRIGIRVKMKNEMLAILEVIEDSPIKHLVQVDDFIEGVDSLYEEKWDIARFIAYIQATDGQKRTLQMLVKKPFSNPFRLPVPTPQKPLK